MFRLGMFLAVVLTASISFGQDAGLLRLLVVNQDTKEPVPDAVVTVKSTGIQQRTGPDGRAVLRATADGEQTVEIFAPGFETVEIKLAFPLTDTSERVVPLKINFEAGQVTISSTRTGREIEAEPTRVEAIDEEEIDEKISMAPANVSMVVSESTGVQVQQTSATSNTQSVRIQGLDGRYTQILKDGSPSYGGFSGSLSLLEIPPLDLKQVEIIKGPSATLYGAGAIAGVVNFISKNPEEKPVTSLVFNQTSALGTDFSLFRSRKLKRIGYTVLGSANYQRQYDVDDDDFSELPRVTSFGLTPRLFGYLSDRTTWNIGNSFSFQTRKGGDITVLKTGAAGIHQYFENNRTVRNVTTFNLDTSLSGGSRLAVRQSLAFFSRDLVLPTYGFNGDQLNSYTELAYFRNFGKHSVVVGGNAVYDRFTEDRVLPAALARGETRTTFGGFVQDTVDVSPKLSLEGGFRLDHVRQYGTFALPRISALYRFTDKLTSRVGYGLGYKTPSVFTESAEELLFRGVVGIGNTLRAERSQGGTLDFNYRGEAGERVTYSVNQMFFYTQISHPLVLRPSSGGTYRFSNASSPIISRGFETNAKLTYDIAKLFIGYTFTDARAGYLSGDRRLTLLPRHKVNSSLVFEKAESFKAGAEFYFGSRQILGDRTETPRIAEFGLFGEKIFDRYSLFVNAENIFDVRQGKYGPVVLGPHNAPSFAEIYTHLEGRVFNGGIKIRF